MKTRGNMIGLEKLTPAPWAVRESDSHHDKWILIDANDEYVATFEIKEIAERVALAGNAFDVQMRRGWSVKKGGDGKWFVDLWLECRLLADGLVEARTIEADDPFTALINADKWYVANVEKKA